MNAGLWWRERGRDSLFWLRQLAGQLPVRLGRIGHQREQQCAAQEMMPAALFRAHTWLSHLFDLVGGLELLQVWLRLFARTDPLAVEEAEAAAAVLGGFALRYNEVRVATGGWLRLAFRANGNRAFAIGHTIFVPENGRADRSLIVHELVHTFQYERLGSRYIGEALFAQWRLGRGCYDYGGPEGLAQALESGWGYGAYNREAQAQIAQDYVRRLEGGEEVAPYEPYIAALRRGAL